MRLILCGHTRIVILTAHRAYKIGRFRPLRLLCRLLALLFQSRRKHVLFREQYGSFPACLWNYVAVGIRANRNEFEHWKKTRDPRVGEIIGGALRHLVIWQAVGESVTADELHRDSPFISVSHGRCKDLRTSMPHQYARIRGKVVLIDYGENETRRALEETLAQV